jgi:succinylarginine dihydrolase
MWVANAATVSPSADTADGRVHFTPANLVSHFHRSLEAPTTTAILRAIFADAAKFAVHDPLPAVPQLGDEGAANHTRFAAFEDEPGIEFFVFGKHGFGGGLGPARYPARQTQEAFAAIARRHGLAPARTVFAQQNPAAIDAGVFHNDVICVGQRNVLFCHERAFVDQHAVLADLAAHVEHFTPVVVRERDVSVADAVATYLFNSQLIARPDGRMLLVAPAECRENPRVDAFIDALVASNGPIAEVLTFDLKQSMKNGGGPACLRLRVALTSDERKAVRARIFLDEPLATAIEQWIRRHYRDRLAPGDLADPALLDESRRALDELSQLLKIGSVYAFQRDAG